MDLLRLLLASRIMATAVAIIMRANAKALSGLTAPDARQVYTNLLAASERHLTAFEHWIADE